MVKNSNDSITNCVIKNSLFGCAQTFFSAFFAFLIRTFFIIKLGDECLGLSNLCLSIMSVLNVVDLGINQSIPFLLYKPLVRNDCTEINKQLCFYRRVFYFLGGSVFILGLMVMPFIKYFIAGQPPAGINIFFVFFVYILNSSLSYFSSGYKSLLFFAAQKSYYNSLVYMCSMGCVYLFQIIPILNRYYYFFILSLLLSHIVAFLFYYYGMRNKFPNFRCSGNVEKAFIKKLFGSTIVIGFYRIRDTLRFSIDSTVVSAYFGLSSLSYYQNYFLIFSLLNTLRYSLVGTISSSLGSYNVSKSRDDVYSVFKLILFVELFISGLFSICFYLLADRFIVLWIGNERLLSRLISILFSLFLFVLGISEAFKISRDAFGLWKKGIYNAILESVLNVLLSILFAKVYGMEGVLLATIICVVFVNISYDSKCVLADFFGKGYFDCIKIIVFEGIWVVSSIIILSLIIPFLNFCNESIFGGMILCVAACFASILLFIFFFFPTKEFKLFLGSVRSVF